MFLLVAIVLGGVLIWLKIYTNHGQKLELKDYIDQPYEKAAKNADKQSFELIVKDSIHKVGRPGGIILSQNPPAGALVKENRKIYVDVTKYSADKISLSNISTMYGRKYKAKENELSYLDISTSIRGYRQDPGEPDHILEVYYKGQLIEGASGQKRNIEIEKGATLEFVLSKIEGGHVDLPDLVCRQYRELNFLLPSYRLKLGGAVPEGAITDKNTAYVISQEPAHYEGAVINMGESIKVVIQQEQPESCK